MPSTETWRRLADPLVGTGIAIGGVILTVALIKVDLPGFPGTDEYGGFTDPMVVPAVFGFWFAVAIGVWFTAGHSTDAISLDRVRTPLALACVAGFEAWLALFGVPWVDHKVHTGHWSSLDEHLLHFVLFVVPAGITACVWSLRRSRGAGPHPLVAFVAALAGIALGTRILSRDILYFALDYTGLLYPPGAPRPRHLWVVHQPWIWSCYAIIAFAPLVVQLLSLASAVGSASREPVRTRSGPPPN